MRKKRSGGKVILNSIIYSCSGLLLKCFSVFLLPLYTVYLTAADYGITSITGSFTKTMGFVVTLSLFSAITRFYVEFKDDPEKLKRFYGTVVVFSLLSGIGWALLLTVFQKPLSLYVFSGIDYYPVIMICLLSLIFNVQHHIYNDILKSQQKAMKASIVSIAFFFVTLGLNILFVVVLEKGVIGVLLSSLITDIVFFGVFMVDMIRSKAISFCLDIKLLKSALKYSIPIMPHNLSTQIATLISKAMIGGAASLTSLGLYSVAAQFGNMADTIQTYVNSAYAPWLYEKLHNKEVGYKITIRNTVRLLISVIGLLMLGLALFAQDYIVLFLEKSYAQAWRFVPLIVLVFAIKIVYYFYVNILFYYKKASRLLFTATLTGSLINVLLSAFMISVWGAYGSILADAIAMLIRVLVIVVISLRFEDIGLKIRDFVFNFIMIAVFIFVGLAPSYLRFDDSFSILNFVYKIVVVLLYIFLMFIQHKEQITGWLKGLKFRSKGDS